jgi:hypothetical protein
MLDTPLDIRPDVVERMVDSFIRNKGYTFNTGNETPSPEEVTTEATGEPQEAPTEPSSTVGSPEAQSPSAEPPTASSEPIDPQAEPKLYMLTTVEGNFTFYSNNGDGTSTYLDEEGEGRIFSNASVRAAYNK